MKEHTIAYLVDQFPAGVETFVLSEMEGLEAAGVRTIVFSPAAVKARVPHALAKKWAPTAVIAGSVFSFRVLCANACFLAASPVKYLRLLLRNEGKQKFLKAMFFAWMARKKAVSHVHAHFAWNGASALLLSKMTGVPFSCTMHGSDIMMVPPKTMPDIINASKFTVMISQYNRDYVAAHWPSADLRKLNVVRLGINFERFRTVQRTGEHAALRILTVARLHQVKQLPFHLEVCHALRDRGYKFTWHFIGEGKERSLLEKIIKAYGLEAYAVLRGAVPYEQMANEYQNADIAVLLSEREGIPAALMEAMATGLPVVASKITGIPELVEDGITGYLVEGRDTAAAAEAIITLLRSAALRGRLGRNGRMKIATEYGQSGNAAKMKALLLH